MNARWPRIAVPLVAASIFVFYFFLFEGVGRDYWDTYIAVPATFLAGRPAVITDERGQPKYEYHLGHRLPHDLLSRDTYGVVSKDQRVGAGVTLAPAYLVFGVLGFRLLYAAFGAMAFLFAYLLGRRLFDGEWAHLALGLIVAANPCMLMMNRLNANFLSVPILAAFLVLLLAERPRWLLAGLVYGALGGIRNEVIVLVPALVVLFAARREHLKGLPIFGAGALVGIAPYLAWNRFAFGRALIHASQYEGFDGFRPMFPHEILGWRFELNGLFNWPFHDHLVRTPHYAFPTYLTLPLVLVLCFGVGLTALGLLGAPAQWRHHRRVCGVLMLWIVFVLGLFLFQENWEEPKTTFAALILVPWAILMVRGAAWLLERPRAWRRWAAFAVALLVVEAGVQAARLVNVPVDERWYQRFPKAKVEAPTIGCLADEQRREWMLFHTDECPAEVDFQKRKLTAGCLLPRQYYPVRLRAVDLAAEWGYYRPAIFDIWYHIYGY